MSDDALSSPEIHPIAGFRLGTASAGIKTPGRRDLVIMSLTKGSTCAAVFTRNAFCAAPVTVAREHLAVRRPEYLLVNTGNANAGTGRQGIVDARQCCTQLAELAGCPPGAVAPFSTGVIGEPLPVTRIAEGLPAALAHLSEDGWTDAAHGIMTTDTVPKLASRRIDIDGHAVTVTGMAKGAGMIRPDMATMLAFIATDAALDGGLLQVCLERAVAGSFNRITVDGDTSTNDACVLVATGRTTLPRVIRDRCSLRTDCGHRCRCLPGSCPGDRARWRGGDQVRHHRRRTGGNGGRMPAGGLYHRALTPGKNGPVRR